MDAGLNRSRQLALLSFVVLFAFLISGCATRPINGGPIDMVSRDNNAVSHGDISSEYGYPLLRTMVIDIDRRTYLGNIEPTAPNNTFDLYRLYGPGRYAAGPPITPGRNIYYKAILSSADHHILRCDLTRNEGKPRDGLCVDDFGKIYDVMVNSLGSDGQTRTP
jgi:hypothetical protein